MTSTRIYISETLSLFEQLCWRYINRQHFDSLKYEFLSRKERMRIRTSHGQYQGENVQVVS